MSCRSLYEAYRAQFCHYMLQNHNGSHQNEPDGIDFEAQKHYEGEKRENPCQRIDQSTVSKLKGYRRRSYLSLASILSL